MSGSCWLTKQDFRLQMGTVKIPAGLLCLTSGLIRTHMDEGDLGIADWGGDIKGVSDRLVTALQVSLKYTLSCRINLLFGHL